MKSNCVYCLQERNITDFNREHVIPESFGTFGANTPVLNNKEVCRDCNSYFSKSLELNLGRDTLDGYYRYIHGLKPEKDFKSLGRSSNLIKTVAEGEYAGAYYVDYYSEDLKRISMTPIPQIILIDKDGNKNYILIDETPAYEELKAKGFHVDGKILMLGVDEGNSNQITNIMKAKGFLNFKSEGFAELDPNTPLVGEMKGKITEKIDDNKFRAMAKIAFNYVTYFEGKEFVLQKDFDTIRKYIRHGEIPDYPLVYPDQKPILTNEYSEKYRCSGHIITINYADDMVSIVSRVSLMNILTYSICLAREYKGDPRNITRGQFFDPHGKQIIDLSLRSEKYDRSQ